MTRRSLGAATAKTSIALAVAALVAGALIADSGSNGDGDELEPDPRHRQTSIDIVDRLREGHFIRKALDDEVSRETFDNYLEFLDPRRMHFLAADLAEFEPYRERLDDALRVGDLEPAFVIYNRYRQRARERLGFEAELIELGIDQFDFTLDESIDIDRSEADWTATQAQLDDLWRRDLKSRALSGKLAGESFESIGEALAKRGQNRERVILQTHAGDVFQRFMNAFALTYDEHTQYFSPRDSEDFGIYMSLSLQGIGAELETPDEYTVVRRLVPGGPADKGGDLKPRDRIIAVGQGTDQPFVSIVGWRSDDVVQIIRGPKGSQVRLRVIPAGAREEDARTVVIVRDDVKLIDQSASKSMLTLNPNGREIRVGIVDIPTFYADFKAMESGDPEYKSTTRDVVRLIEELKADNMDALIVDLRRNGGGSLQEAVELTGLFVDSGPVVQVKSLRGRPRVLGDNDGSAVWEGPLAVMVNRGSASASEIFAGAVQDYGLGVVVGSQTFGKGTVQTLVQLPQQRGQLKLTERKFYRVSGASTHYNGIVPDIEYPSPNFVLRQPREMGGVIDGPGAAVDAVRHDTPDRVSPYVEALRRRHEERVAADAEFVYLRARSEYLERLQDRTRISLSEATRLAEKATDDAWALRIENELLAAKGEEPVASLDDLDLRDTRAGYDTDDPASDTLVQETANILVDYIHLSRGIALADIGADP